MGRATAMLERLPVLYRDGDLVRELVDVLGLQQEILDEELLEVQRPHWFDTCFELEEAAVLGSVLDIEPEPWQDLLEYRPWVHALRDARLREGSVTVDAIRLFVDRYRDGFEAANAASITTGPTAIVENPDKILLQRVGATEPLQRLAVTNHGLDPTPVAALITGLGSTGPEHAPLLANLTTGEAIVFRGVVPPGQRLVMRPIGGELVAELEGNDVTGSLRRISGLTHGPTGPGAVSGPPVAPLVLERGINDLWFLPLSHFDTLGLDRMLLALAELSLQQGRWSKGQFDDAIFYQAPAMAMTLAWAETTPATFRVDLDASVMQSRPGDLDEAVEARGRLEFALDTAIDRLAAAGVRSDARLLGHRDAQPVHDRLAAVFPMIHREGGPTGADLLPDSGAVFDVTDFDDSTMR